jgi:hypothetical protein
MAGDETLTWFCNHPRAGCLQGGFSCLSAATLSLLVLVWIFAPGLWVFIYIGVMIAAGAVIGIVAGRREVQPVEFTRRHVRLMSRVSSRTVKVADLTAVAVEHSGDTDEGYTMTSLRLAWPDGGTEVDGFRDPTLASSLTELLGPGVQVQEEYTKLKPPPASA